MKDQHYELYLGECSTLNGLSYFDPESELQITKFLANNYQEIGWTTEQDIPKLKSVASIIFFLETEGDVGLVEFDVFGNVIWPTSALSFGPLGDG